MKEVILEQKKRLKLFFLEYGKVFFSSIFLCCALIFISLLIKVATTSPLHVSFLDVGQGDAILVKTPSGKSMLIDGGATNIVLSRVDKELSFFDRDIDVLVATHPDADHVTGLIPVLEKYSVKIFASSPSRGDTKISEDLEKHVNNESSDIYIARKGDVINFHDGVTATVLYPRANYLEKKNDTNDASVSIVLTYGDKTFLFTGDLPSVREGELITNALTKSITVYKAGHHGSKYSSSEQLLSYIKPEYSVISAGKDNTYGHPNPEAVERLKKYSNEIISTIDRGTITFSTDGKNMDLETSK